MQSNIPKHPCAGKCTEFNEDRCNTCLILTPACGYCGSEQSVFQIPTKHYFICSDCIGELQPADFFISPEIDEYHARAVLAQGEIS